MPVQVSVFLLVKVKVDFWVANAETCTGVAFGERGLQKVTPRRARQPESPFSSSLKKTLKPAQA